MERSNRVIGEFLQVNLSSKALALEAPPAGLLKVSLLSSIIFPKVRKSPSFQRSLDHGHHVIELHAWRSTERTSFATFIYEKAADRLLRHFFGADENEVIRQSLVWCEQIRKG